MAGPGIKLESIDSILHDSGQGDEFATPLPAWKKAGEDMTLQNVLIKEQASKFAYSFLGKLYMCFNKHLQLNSSCEPRIRKVEEIQSRRKEVKLRCGFLGSTGSGKSSLINSLLGFNLLPTSSYRASTAVVVEIAWNDDMSAETAFRAKINFIRAEDWRAELEQLFTDLAMSSTEEDDMEEDEERESRINEIFDKLKCVYPHIRTRENLQEMSVEKLMEDPYVMQMLGNPKNISGSELISFASAIRPYIDSGVSGKHSAPWPLVKIVQVYCKAEILHQRVCLVDLPGNADSNSARSSCAESKIAELSVTCVVSCSTRGISEKNAHELLQSVTKRNLQLDGNYTADSLCFILTKTDLSFDPQQYIRDHPEVAAACKPFQEKISETKAAIQSIKDQEKALLASRLQKKRLVVDLNKGIKECETRLGIPRGKRTSKGQKRKRGPDCENQSSENGGLTVEQMASKEQISRLEEQVEEEKDLIRLDNEELLKFSRRTKSLEGALFHDNSSIVATCIKSRNQLSTAAISQDYETALQEMGRVVSDPLQVFCVAAAVHLKYLNTDKRQTGFPEIEDTKIGALRDFLISTTLPKRNIYAQAFLDEVNNLLVSMRPWITDVSGNPKMTIDMRKIWEGQLELHIQELEQAFTELNKNSTNSMKLIVGKGLFARLSQAEIHAAKKSKKTVEKWAKETYWSTHRCVNRGRGRWVDSRRKEYKWNEELSLDLTRPLLTDWQKTFFEKMPLAFETHVTNAMQLITDFSQNKLDENYCLDVVDGKQLLRDHVNAAQRVLRFEKDRAFEDYKQAMKKTHRQGAPTIKEFLEPMYDRCSQDTGKGHFVRNKKRHVSIMEKHGGSMHRAAREAIQNAINEVLNSIPERLAVGHDAAIQHIREGVVTFFEKNSNAGPRTSDRKAINKDKVKLQQDVNALFSSLRADWQKELVPSTQHFPNSIDEMEDENGLFDVNDHEAEESEWEDDRD